MPATSSRARILAFVLTFIAAAVFTPAAQAQLMSKDEAKACKQKTKTMGCALDGLTGAVRATAVAAGGPLAGKCQIDSPAVTPEKRSHEADGLLCDDPAIADTGDTMIGLCKDASNAVRANCRTICAKLEKIDPLTGDPIEGSPCRMVVDRTVVTTKTERNPSPKVDGCRATCEASIVCVCDP